MLTALIALVSKQDGVATTVDAGGRRMGFAGTMANNLTHAAAARIAETDGEVVAAEAPLGLMGGPRQATAEFVAGSPDGSGGRDTETLYMELRQGALPVDPMDWFAGLARTGD